MFSLPSSLIEVTWEEAQSAVLGLPNPPSHQETQVLRGRYKPGAIRHIRHGIANNQNPTLGLA